MRVGNIKIHLEIPVNGSDENGQFTDGNGVVYTVDAIKEACEKAVCVPFVVFNEAGKAVPLGVMHSFKWNQAGFIETDGTINFGGTCETPVFGDDGKIVSMEITEIGFAQ